MAGVSHAPGGRPRASARASPGSASSEVSRICAALDDELANSGAARWPASAYPYVWLDATYEKVREARSGGEHGGARRDRSRPQRRATHPRSRSLIRSTTILSPGRRFIRSLMERGLARCPPRDHRRPCRTREGDPRAAPGRIAGSVAASTCTRNAQDLVPRSARSMVACAIRIVLRAARRGRSARAARPHDRQLAAALRGSSRTARRRPSQICSPTSRSPRPTGARYAARTRSSGSTRRSSAGAAVVRIFPNRAERDPPRRDDPRRAGRRVAGRPALLPARDDGSSSMPPPEPEEVSQPLLMAS